MGQNPEFNDGLQFFCLWYAENLETLVVHKAFICHLWINREMPSMQTNGHDAA